MGGHRLYYVSIFGTRLMYIQCTRTSCVQLMLLKMMITGCWLAYFCIAAHKQTASQQTRPEFLPIDHHRHPHWRHKWASSSHLHVRHHRLTLRKEPITSICIHSLARSEKKFQLDYEGDFECGIFAETQFLFVISVDHKRDLTFESALAPSFIRWLTLDGIS